MSFVTRTLDRFTAAKPTVLSELSGLRLIEETDVRGFDTGLIIDQPRKQVTVTMGIGPTSINSTATITETPGAHATDDTSRHGGSEGAGHDAGHGAGHGAGDEGSMVISETQWRGWEDAIAQTQRMVATATIDEAGDNAEPPRIATTFRAVGKQQRKDLNELVTDISLRQAELYERAEQLGISVRPLDSTAIVQRVRHALLPTTGQGTDHLFTSQTVRQHCALDQACGLDNLSVRHNIEDIIVNDHHRFVAMSVDISDPGAAEHLDTIMDDWSGEALLRRTRFFRPYVLPEGTGEDLTTGAGRRWAIVTVQGNALADTALRGAFDATVSLSLSMRRMRGRQRTGVLAGLGIGVLGFQHATDAISRPDLTLHQVSDAAVTAGR